MMLQTVGRDGGYDIRIRDPEGVASTKKDMKLPWCTLVLDVFSARAYCQRCRVRYMYRFSGVELTPP